MRETLKKLPQPLQEAYKKAPSRPDHNTPACILSFINEDMKNFGNMFVVNKIVDFVDPTLLDLELDETEGNELCYNMFAYEVALKIMSFVDVDGDKKVNKQLSFYENNESIKRLKVKDFTALGDLSEKTNLEKADILAEFYGVENSVQYLGLTQWEKELFAAKAINREKTSLEKK